MSEERFARNGSPLGGKRIPHGWKAMEWPAKCHCLVANGWACDFYEASRRLAEHAGAARQGRKVKEQRRLLAMARFED
jgi:hypothetical protein